MWNYILMQHINFILPALECILAQSILFTILGCNHLRTFFFLFFLILGAGPDVGNGDNWPRRSCSEQTRRGGFHELEHQGQTGKSQDGDGGFCFTGIF